MTENRRKTIITKVRSKRKRTKCRSSLVTQREARTGGESEGKLVTGKGSESEEREERCNREETKDLQIMMLGKLSERVCGVMCGGGQDAGDGARRGGNGGCRGGVGRGTECQASTRPRKPEEAMHLAADLLSF